MDTMLEIVPIDGECRVDSRLVARSLGIEHESFLRTITTYQAEIEELGALRFQIGVLKHEKYRGSTRFRYTMLNEDQAIFLATLSRNTSQVVKFKLQLTKAFSEARRALQGPVSSVHTLTERFRPRALENMLRIPDGYFSVMGELFKHLYNAEALLNQSLDEHAMIEISVGQRWSRYAREVLNIPDQERRKYPHLCQDNRTEYVWAYPTCYVDRFGKWLWMVYFPEQFSAYTHYRARYIGLLPAPKREKSPPGGKRGHALCLANENLLSAISDCNIPAQEQAPPGASGRRW